MSIELATLVARLQASTPQHFGQPADYGQVVQDAVAQLGRDVPMMASTVLAIAPGVDSYELPGDFLTLIQLEPWVAADGVSMATGRVIALPVAEVHERVWTEGDRLRISPAPTYSAMRSLRYGAGYALEDGVYPRLTENGARVALLYGQHLVLMAQAAAAGAAGWKYQIGDEMVDRSQQGSSLRTLAESAQAQYMLAVKPLKGYGQRAW